MQQPKSITFSSNPAALQIPQVPHIQLEEPPMRGTFDIIRVERAQKGDQLYIAITGLHETGVEEEVLIPLRNPTQQVMTRARGMLGKSLPKPVRTLIPDPRELGMLIVRITPYEALQILRNNELQRGLNLGDVESYMRYLDTGRWHLHAGGISIDWNGLCMDGQHRLFTCLLTGRSLPISLMWGCNPEGRRYIDCGSSRSPGQTDEIMGGCEGGLPSGSKIEQVITKIFILQGGAGKANVFYTAIKNHYLDELEWYHKFLDPYAKLDDRHSLRKNLRLGLPVIFATMVMLRKAYGEQVDDFLECLLQGHESCHELHDYLAYTRSSSSFKQSYLDIAKAILEGFEGWASSSPSKKPAKAKRRSSYIMKVLQLWKVTDLLPPEPLEALPPKYLDTLPKRIKGMLSRKVQLTLSTMPTIKGVN